MKNIIFLYKMRTLESLSDERKELENTELYFAPFEELNDPMEGFINFIWKGDKVLWINLFNHYILQLQGAVMYTHIVLEDDYSIYQYAFRMRQTFNNLETEELKNIVKSIQNMFLSYHDVQDTIDYLTKPEKEIKGAELIEIFNQLHFLALRAVFTIFKNNHLVKDNWLDNISDFSGIKITNKFKTIAPFSYIKDAAEKIAEIDNIMREQISLMIQYNNYGKTDSYKKRLLLFDFPILFVNKLIELIYVPTYITSFSLNCTNPVLWSHYADNHKGYCLKFKSSYKHDYWSIHDFKLPIYNIVYTNKYPTIDFFKSLGTLRLDEEVNTLTIFHLILQEKNGLKYIGKLGNIIFFLNYLNGNMNMNVGRYMQIVYSHHFLKKNHEK